LVKPENCRTAAGGGRSGNQLSRQRPRRRPLPPEKAQPAALAPTITRMIVFVLLRLLTTYRQKVILVKVEKGARVYLVDETNLTNAYNKYIADGGDMDFDGTPIGNNTDFLQALSSVDDIDIVSFLSDLHTYIQVMEATGQVAHLHLGSNGGFNYNVTYTAKQR
jgi:hypothetical protein